MSTTVLGKVSMTPKGAWNARTLYEPLDVVSYGGNAFLARRTNSNVTPTEGEDWQMIAEKATIGNIAQTTGADTDKVMSQKATFNKVCECTNTVNLYDYNLKRASLDNGSVVSWNSRIVTADFIPLGDAKGIKIWVDSGHEYSLAWYSNEADESYMGGLTPDWNAECRMLTIPNNAKFIRVVGRKTAGGDFSNADYTPVNVQKIIPDIEMTNLKVLINESAILLSADMFSNGSWENGERLSSSLRVALIDPIRNVKAGEYVTVNANGLYFHILVWDNLENDSPVLLYEEGWVNEDRTFVIPYDGDLTITIANGANYNISTSISPADISSVLVYHRGDVSQITGRVLIGPSGHSYVGEKIPSKVNYFDSQHIFTMSYSSSAMTSQDIEISGDYLFVGFSRSEQIRVYSLLTKQSLADISVDIQHGGGMQFSKEYYADGDAFPLLYVGGGDNLINVIRIQNTENVWSATVIKTISIPAEYGYYATPCVDAESNTMYIYGHSGNSFQIRKPMILSKWDLNDLSENGDGTLTPVLLSKCYCPYIGTTQGRKYYRGNIYIGTSNTSSPHNSRLVVLDAGTGEVKTSIDMTGVTASEAEGLCYQIDGNNIYWYFTDYYKVFKLTF